MRQQLTPRELADAINVSESSVKRWIDQGSIRAVRTTGGHRRVPLTEAVRFIRDSGMTVVRPHVLGLPDATTAAVEDGGRSDPHEVLRRALLEGRSEIVRGTVFSLYLSGASVAEICDHPMAQAMAEVGELWKHDMDGILIEHRATDLCSQTLNLVRSLAPDPEPDALVALGGAPTDDPYLLPSLMVATVLAVEGWRVVNLGPDVPLDVIERAARKEGAQLVWLAATAGGWAERPAAGFQRFARRITEGGSTLAVGGRGFPKDLRPIPSGVYRAESMAEMVALARGIRQAAGGSGPSPGVTRGVSR